MSITQKKSGNKLRAIKTEYKGTLFDSKKEAHRAYELDLLKRAGDIKKIEYQVPYPCIVNGKKVCTYVLDFRVTYADGHIEHEDVKGYKKGATYAVFRVKKKLVEALFDIEILEI